MRALVLALALFAACAVAHTCVGGCTRSHGYWKQQCIPHGPGQGEACPQEKKALTDIARTKGMSDMCAILVREWAAVQLNVNENRACLPNDVSDAFGTASRLLTGCPVPNAEFDSVCCIDLPDISACPVTLPPFPCTNVTFDLTAQTEKREVRETAVELYHVLERYNSGCVGPGPCDANNSAPSYPAFLPVELTPGQQALAWITLIAAVLGLIVTSIGLGFGVATWNAVDKIKPHSG